MRQISQLKWVVWGSILSVGLGWAGASVGFAQGNPLALEEARLEVEAQDFSLPQPRQGPLQLSEYRGKVVLLHFWATWCVPCQEEIPALAQVYQRLKDLPFTILAVNVMEPADRVMPFIEKFGIPFPVVLDSSGDVSQMYHADGLPTTYVISKEGFVLFRAVGAKAWGSPEGVRFLGDVMTRRP